MSHFDALVTVILLAGAALVYLVFCALRLRALERLGMQRIAEDNRRADRARKNNATTRSRA